MSDQCLNGFWSGGLTIPAGHSPVVIRHGPCRRGRIVDEPRNQMQVQMLCPFAKGNGIDPITSGEVLHKDTGSLNGPTPVGGFLRVEGKRA